MSVVASSLLSIGHVRGPNWLGRAIQRMVVYSQARQTAQAIAHLDAHLLADIGLLDASAPPSSALPLLTVRRAAQDPLNGD